MRTFLATDSNSSLGIRENATLASLYRNNHWITTYSTGQVYGILSGQGVAVPWSHIIWIAGGIPKHSFLSWLFLLNRCPTRDRLLNWGLQTSPTCLLCKSSPESRDHLYFLCPYSWSLWLPFARRCGLAELYLLDLAGKEWSSTPEHIQIS